MQVQNLNLSPQKQCPRQQSFGMMLDRKASIGLSEIEMDQLAKLIKSVGPKDQKVGFRLLTPKLPSGNWVVVELVSGDLIKRSQIQLGGGMEPLADLLILKYRQWTRDINNVLKTLKFDNENLV